MVEMDVERLGPLLLVALLEGLEHLHAIREAIREAMREAIREALCSSSHCLKASSTFWIGSLYASSCSRAT